MSKAKQVIERSKIKGEATQDSDTAATHQAMRDIEAAGAWQRIRSQANRLALGKYSATGSLAVIALVVIALGWLIAKYLQNS